MYFPDLIAEYKQSLKELRAAGGCPSIERDMQEAIKWMETGYDPAEYRAATRQDTFVMDHHLMQDLILYIDAEGYVPSWMVEHEVDHDSWAEEVVRMVNAKNKINNALNGLTENERAAFIMIRAERMPYSKAAKILGIGKSTIQGYLKRAEMKIYHNNIKSLYS